MFKTNISKSTNFAVDARYIDDYINVQDTTAFAVNTTAATVSPRQSYRLYGGVRFTYGQTGKSCRFAQIGTRPTQDPGDPYFIVNSSGTIYVGSVLPTASETKAYFMLQNDPQYSTYDAYVFGYQNNEQAVMIVPNGYSPPVDLTVCDRLDGGAPSPGSSVFVYISAGTGAPYYTSTHLGLSIPGIVEIMNFPLGPSSTNGAKYIVFPRYSV